jgi:dolichyl-diphosphooligosaccharide--protein glycosyltransferase
MFFLGRDVGGKTVGLFSTLFLALNPSYITRTSLGFFDDETVGIFAMVLFVYFFLRALDKEREPNSALKYAVASGLTLGYFCASWGASLYPLALTALYVFILILLRRYSRRLLFSYSVTCGLGLLIAISTKTLTTSFLLRSSVLPVAGVFGLLCLCELLRLTQSSRWKIAYTISFFAVIIGGFFAVSFLGILRGVGAGKFISVLNPFHRLTVPLIESVAEHHVTAWGSIYYDFGIGVVFFALGIFFAARNLNNRNLFFIVFGVTSLYFACSMVRLTLILAPALCVLWAFGLVRVIKPFTNVIRQSPKVVRKAKYHLGHVGKEFGGVAPILIFLLLTFTFAFPTSQHSIFTHAYSPVVLLAGSLPVRPGEPITEWVDALNWIEATEDVKVVCSWWDYGYWIRIRANKTSLADNATTNKTQIQNVGAIFMSNETETMEIIEKCNTAATNRGMSNITHILVFVTFGQKGGDAGYGDEGKWRWMARIAGESGRFDFRNESDFGEHVYNNETQNYEWQWNSRGTNSTFYKLMMYAKHQMVSGITAEKPRYFEFVYPYDLYKVKSYGNIVPLVAIYRIDYDAYEADYPS